MSVKIEDVVEYWFSRIDEGILNVDASEAHERCWRCGYEAKLEKCHIIPDSLGGEKTPSNLVLLCKRCHLENPNVKNPEIMWDWLKAYKAPLYDTFWLLQGMREYEYIYGINPMEDLNKREIINEKEFMKQFEIELKNATPHFGNRYLNAATIAGVFRITLTKFGLK